MDGKHLQEQYKDHISDYQEWKQRQHAADHEVEEWGLDSFKTVAGSIQTHYLDILNFFNNRSTNASAESFNAKIKAFRSSSRGVRDIIFLFFLFRLTKLYA